MHGRQSPGALAPRMLADARYVRASNPAEGR